MGTVSEFKKPNIPKGQAPKGQDPKDVPIDQEKYPEVYDLLSKVIKEWHWDDLEHAKVAIAWHKGWHANTDGVMKFADVKVCNELDQRLHGFDFTIKLNQEFWQEWSPEHRAAVLDEALEYCAPKLDDNGKHVQLADGRRVWRKRTPEVCTFSTVLERRGPWHAGLQEACKVVIRNRRAPLFKGLVRE